MEDENDKRFVIELEFIQCLANPQYLQYLAQTGILDQPEFINYLTYLTYFQSPRYVKYIVYPYCLQILDLLLSAGFRLALKSADVAGLVHRLQYAHWEEYAQRYRDGSLDGCLEVTSSKVDADVCKADFTGVEGALVGLKVDSDTPIVDLT